LKVNERLDIPNRDLPPGRLQLRKEHLVSELSTHDRVARRRRRRVGLVVVPAVLILFGLTGFTTYVLTREPTHMETVGCFERASLNANVAVVSADGRDPAVICREIFQAGDLPGAPVPHELDSCVLDTGAIGVFPSSGATTCEELGLADLPASYAVEGKRFGALRDAILAQVGEPASGSTRGGPQCIGEDEARAIVRRELDAHGYADWDVKVIGEPFSAERPCADIAFGENTVFLAANGPRS
jgi:hypothetical protein